MSDETELSTAADSIQDSLGSAVDPDEIESMLEDDSVDAVGRELGSRIGREVGARTGAALGPAVARDIRERKSIREILRNAAQRLVKIVAELFRSADFRTGVSRVVEVGRDVASKDSVSGGLGSVLPGSRTDSEAGESEDAEAEVEDESEAGETESGEEESEEGDAEGGTEASSDDGTLSGADLSADEMRELKEETYKELLEAMSYRDLQSLAKDVGVKANLAQDELTDRIVAKFSEEGDA